MYEQERQNLEERSKAERAQIIQGSNRDIAKNLEASHAMKEADLSDIFCKAEGCSEYCDESGRRF